MNTNLYEIWNTQKRIDNLETMIETIYNIVRITYLYVNEFDWKKYAQMYPDLKENGIVTETQLYNHWIQYGNKEGRCAGIVGSVLPYEDFDYIQYALYCNYDLQQGSKTELYDDWCVNGRYENLCLTDISTIHKCTHTEEHIQVSDNVNIFVMDTYNKQFVQCLKDEIALFDWKYYLTKYPDLLQFGYEKYSDAFFHWIIHGKNENRFPNEKCDIEFHQVLEKLKIQKENEDALNKQKQKEKEDALAKHKQREKQEKEQFERDIKNIPAYIINLKERVDKKIDTIYQLEQGGIVNPVVFKAYDKNHTPVAKNYDEYNEKYQNGSIRTTLYNSRRLYKVISSIGAMGLIYTTVELFKSLQDKDVNYVMICEDDIKLHKDFKTRFQSYKRELNGRDILYLGFNNHIPAINKKLLTAKNKRSHQITYPEDRNSYYGTYGYICSKKFRQKIIELGVDWFIRHNSTIDYGYNQLIWEKQLVGAVPTGEQYIMPDIFDPYCINKNRQNKGQFYKNRHIDVTKFNQIPYYNHTFVFIVPSFNNSEWIERNLQSIFEQTYVNWKIIYINDNSTDDTHDKFMELSKSHMDKITYIQDTTKYGQAFNRYRAYNLCEDSDICIMLDGDDWLASPFVLQYLVYFMHINQVDVTYGHFQSYSNGVLSPYISENTKHGYSDEVVKKGTYRSDIWRGMHLRVMRAKYLKRVDPMDFIMSDGSFIYCATDMVESFTALELSKGTHAKISEVLYTYNLENSVQYPTSYYHEKDKSAKQKIYSDVKRLKSYRNRVVKNKVAVVYVDDSNFKKHLEKYRDELMEDTDLFLCLTDEVSNYANKIGGYETIMFIE